MGLKLYQSDLSPACTRVRVLAAAKGLKLECVPPPGGNPQSAEYLAINPIGRLPCLDHDGFLLPESETICEYLEDNFSSPTLRPVDAQVRAQVRLMSRIADIYVAPALAKFSTQADPGARDAALVDQAVAESEAAFGYLAKFLEGPRYAVGGRLSLADCSLAPLLFLFDSAIKPFFGHDLLVGDVAIYYAGLQGDTHVAKALSEMKAALAERMKHIAH